MLLSPLASPPWPRGRCADHQDHRGVRRFLPGQRSIPRAPYYSISKKMTRPSPSNDSAWAPATIRGLVLLGAPLCFEPEQSRFRDALASLVPPAPSEAEPYPGSLLSQMSALASPRTFIWSRLMDAALSLGGLSCNGSSCAYRTLGAR